MTVRVATSVCRMVRLSVMSVGAVMDYLACWWTLKWGAMRLGDSSLASHSKVLFNKELTSQAFKSPALWKCPLMNFPCLFFFLLYFVLSQYVNTMAIGDKLDEKGGFCLIHGLGMLFSFNLHTNSCDEVHGNIHV